MDMLSLGMVGGFQVHLPSRFLEMRALNQRSNQGCRVTKQQVAIQAVPVVRVGQGDHGDVQGQETSDRVWGTLGLRDLGRLSYRRSRKRGTKALKGE